MTDDLEKHSAKMAKKKAARDKIMPERPTKRA